MRKLRIFIDVDETLAETMEEVLRWYNLDWDDTLTVNKITEWNLEKFVKCGDKIYKYFSMSHIYTQIARYPYSLDAVRNFKKIGHEVFFSTATVPGGEGMKFDWLVRNGFLERDERERYIEIQKKDVLSGDVMIDDGYHNLEKFRGYKIMPVRAWNSVHSHQVIPVYNWKEIERQVDYISRMY